MPPILTTTATVSSLPGSDPITVSGATDPNCTITFTAGALTITLAPSTPNVRFIEHNLRLSDRGPIEACQTAQRKSNRVNSLIVASVLFTRRLKIILWHEFLGRIM